MRITARELNRSTLSRQLLLCRKSLDVVDAVRRVIALQAQHAASPYLALWSRLNDFDPAHLDAAFTGHAVVKATLMRATLHAVHANDYHVFHEAMQPTLRPARLNDRLRPSGLTVAEVDALVPDLLEFAGRPRTAADCEAWLAARLGVQPKPGVWWGLKSVAPLLHATTGGLWSFGPRPSYVAAGTGLVPEGQGPHKSLQTLVLRYLEGFGPASTEDVAQFARVQRSRAREALCALADDLEQLEGPNGVQLFDVPGAPRPAEDTPAPPRLMAMWDSTLLAYADRSRIIPPDYRKSVIRSNGDVLPTLLIDGYVAGVWRPVEGGIEATAFHRLPVQAWKGLAAEARALVAFLADREPLVYHRYSRWWSNMDGAETRVLPGVRSGRMPVAEEADVLKPETNTSW